MTADGGSQADLIEFLGRAGTLGPAAPERAETHISVVFLTGDKAWKLKRAVKFPYLDFSTPAKRKAACEAEVAINRRTAPEIYLGVVPVRRAPGGEFALGDGEGEEEGEIVDWLVEMARFDQATLFDRLAQEGALDRPMMEALADEIAAFHAEVEIHRDRGGAALARAVNEGNAQSFEAAGDLVDAPAVAALIAETAAAIDGVAELLDARRDEGRVRHCHGDLHLRNIFLHDGRPTLFDAIEFNPELANIDVLYDLAFLLMDLDHRGQRRLANYTFNRYLSVTGDVGGVACLPVFLSLRAAVRAHVSASAAKAVADAAEAEEQAREAGRYLALARAYLVPVTPRLVAVGGLSGSGKSHLAREIAGYFGAAPGAVIARTDAIRKRLAGISVHDRLDESAYSKEMTERTYAAARADTATALAGGYAAVADAVFAGEKERRAIEETARAAGVPFTGLWLEAPAEVMAARIGKRIETVSDATEEVLRRQMSYDLGDMTWTRIDTSGSREDTLAKALAALGLEGAAA